MNSISDERRTQIERNYEAFSQKINEYIAIHANKYALMHDGDVVEFYSDLEDAYKTGMLLYKEDKLFSIQKVTRTPVDLGFYSHAVHIG